MRQSSFIPVVRRHISKAKIVAIAIAFSLYVGLGGLFAPYQLLAQTDVIATSVPRLIRFSGVVTSAEDKPLSGAVGVTFAIYADQQGGAPLWMETRNVNVNPDGSYVVLLGESKPEGLPLSVFASTEARWLGVRAENLAEQPRVMLVSVPYALKAMDAETLGGLPASAFVLAGNNSTAQAGPSFAANSQVSPALTSLTGSGTTDYVPLWTSSSALGNSIMSQGTATGGGTGIGINTTSYRATLTVNGTGAFLGNVGALPTGNASATAGVPSAGVANLASVFNSTTHLPTIQKFAFEAEPAGNNTAAPSATLNLLFGTGIAAGGYNETGFHFNADGTMTFANGQSFPGVLPLAGGTMTGNITFAGTQSFPAATSLSCTGCVSNTQLGINYAAGDTQGGNATNALMLGGQFPSFYAPASGSANYVAKTGDTMTGALNLPANGLLAGTTQLTLVGGYTGVGTASPITPLDVRRNGSSLSNSSITSDSNAVGYFENNGNATNVWLNVKPANMGGTDENFYFGLNGAYVGGIRYNATGDYVALFHSDSNSNNLNSEPFVVKNRNVGVDTTNPQYPLDVAGNINSSGTVSAAHFSGDGTNLTGVTSSGLTCSGCITNTQLGINYAAGDAQGGNATNALLFGGQPPSFYAPATGSANYVAKAGDTMTGTLNLPANGLIAGGSQLALSGGNVGVGTATPSVALDVENGSVIINHGGTIASNSLASMSVRTLTLGLRPDNWDSTLTFQPSTTDLGTIEYGTVAHGQAGFNFYANGTSPVMTVAPSGNVGVTGTVTAAHFSGDGTNLTGVTSSGLTCTGCVTNADLGTSAVNAGNIASGQVVKSVNGLTDAVTLAAGTNIGLGIGGQTITINNTAPVGWTLAGNAGTVDGTNFLGTTDNVPLNLYVNGTRAFRVEPQIDTASGNLPAPNVIGGSSYNATTNGAIGATIAGGGEGGNQNVVSAKWGTVGGGSHNFANGAWSTVAGGIGNTAAGDYSTVAGGSSNLANGLLSFVAGGNGNSVYGRGSFAAGQLTTDFNGTAARNGVFLFGDNSTTGLGINLVASADNQFLARATGGFQFIAGITGGGQPDPTKTVSIAANSGIITFASGQTFPGALSSAGGTMTGNITFAGSQTFPAATSLNCAGCVSNGNIATGQVVKSVNGLTDAVTLSPGTNIGFATLGNTIMINSTAPVAWALGGNAGTGCSTSPCPDFLGTTDNDPLEIHVNNVRAFRVEPTIDSYTTSGSAPNVVGGYSGNVVNSGAGDFGSTIAGGGESGFVNTVNGRFGAIGGGAANTAGGYSTVAGGLNNSAGSTTGTSGSGTYIMASTVGGGNVNTASGAYATIPGGFENTASGTGSFAAGQYTTDYDGTNHHNGVFLWGDNSTASNLVASADNQFLARAAGGFQFVTAYSGSSPDLTKTVSIAANSGIMTFASGQTFPGVLSSAGGTMTGNITFAGSQSFPAATSLNCAGCVSNGNIATGQVVKSVNGLTDAVTLSPGTNIFFGTSGNTITINAPGTVAGWSLGGNSGTGCSTSPCTDFLGTTDNSAVEIEVDGNRVYRFEPVPGFFLGFTPNVIGGYSGNSVTSGVAGATIAGGGSPNSSNWCGAAASCNNTVSGNFGTVGGGQSNTATLFSVVAGGRGNTASDASLLGYVTVSGGEGNTANQRYATIAGGQDNTLNGEGSFAAGQVTSDNGHSGVFLWGDDSVVVDGTFTKLTASANDQFLARATGGVTFYTSENLTTGVTLAAGGGSWSSVSDRNVKENFAAIDNQKLLGRVLALPITNWNYKSQNAKIRHIGPMAQDFYAAFNVGEDDRHITEIDEGGVALAAIQGLNAKLEQAIRQKDNQIAAQEQQISALRGELALQAAELQSVKAEVEQALRAARQELAQK